MAIMACRMEKSVEAVVSKMAEDSYHRVSCCKPMASVLAGKTVDWDLSVSSSIAGTRS